MIKNVWNRQDSNPCWCPFWPKCTHFTNRKFTNPEITNFPRISANFHMYHMKVHKKLSLKQPLDSFCCLLLSYKKQQILNVNHLIFSYKSAVAMLARAPEEISFTLDVVGSNPTKAKVFFVLFFTFKGRKTFLILSNQQCIRGHSNLI